MVVLGKVVGYRLGLTSVQHTTLHMTAVHSLPLKINDISLLVSNGTNCMNLFHSIQILALHSSIFISIHTQLVIQRVKLILTPDLHCHQYLY